MRAIASRRPRPPKLASGTTARSVEEWIGVSPDTPVPAKVKLRILERQGGKCAITGHKFRPGDKKRLDHKIALAGGGENREANLQWILDDEAHKPKTKAEAAERSKVRDLTKAHHGISPEPQRPLQSRNNLATGKPKSEKLPVPDMPSAMARRFR